ncbi:glycosyltransferase family 4 protein [Planococcus sp. APC 4015]|nr:glycosyltransferase family 4 protein [Planococcus sp. APC 4015]
MTTRGRILVVSLHARPEQTGNAPYVGSLVAGLARDGWSVRLIAAHPHYPQWRVHDGYGQWSRTDTETGVRVHRLRHYVPSNPSGLRRVLAEITFGVRVWATRWGRPDAVVLVSPAMISSAMAMSRARTLSRRTPTVLWVQDLYGRGMAQTETGGRAARGAVAWLERSLVRAADRVIVIHERFRAIVVDELEARDERVAVVRNWSHLSSMEPTVDRELTRSERGWSDEIVVVHGGNQGVKQGLENVVDAARLADERSAPVRFVLVGHGSRHEMLRERAAGIRRIEFLGPMADAEYTATLAAADVLLVNELAGVSDMAVPSKLTTYFRSGRPVLVATEDGSISAEEVQRAGAGCRVDAGDPEALLAGVLTLGADPHLAASLGAAGAEFARIHLEEGAAIRAFSANLDDVLSNPGARIDSTHATPTGRT